MCPAPGARRYDRMPPREFGCDRALRQHSKNVMVSTTAGFASRPFLPWRRLAETLRIVVGMDITFQRIALPSAFCPNAVKTCVPKGRSG